MKTKINSFVRCCRWFPVITALFSLSLISCKKTTENYQALLVNDYYPLQVGKTWIYRLDSTIIPAFGTSLNVVSYLAKDSVESSFPDNLGRNSFRITRFTTDTLQKKSWEYKSTYYITPTEQTVECMDDYNRRFIKLSMPVRELFSWKGNTFIDTKSPASLIRYLDDWDYTYQNINMPFEVKKGMMDSTITILQRDETIPEGPFDPNYYKQRNYSIEVYAKGIGLIYKEFIHWTWQTTPPPSSYEDDSYGIKLSLVK